MAPPFFIATICLTAVFSTGCSDTIIDPFSNEGNYFTVYGFLDPGAQTQRIRVIPVTRRGGDILSTFDLQSEIDAEVVSQHITDSTVIFTNWTHELEQLDDKTYGHFFHADIRVDPGDRYRLEIIRSDGAKSSAITVVPQILDLGYLEHFEPAPNVSGQIVQLVSLPADKNIWDFDAVYTFEGAGESKRLMVQYGSSAVNRSGGVFNIELLLDRDRKLIRDELFKSVVVRGNNPVSLTRIGLMLRVVDPNWYPLTESSDIELLAKPEAFSNVDNGYGLWGALGIYFVEWNVDLEMSALLGYPQ